ncbi:integrase core domain-containing protein, partial [Sphingobium limneticum]|uniref:integrase core domain-containing protein n=1 Tax=Sphingobium limneticum TaxID=1007511 RepID=UPI002012DA04
QLHFRDLRADHDRLDEACGRYAPLPSSRQCAPSRGRFPMCYGPEFISKALDRWAYENGVTLDFSRPGKPTDNAFVESFNGRLRDECLNTHWFLSLDDARAKIEAWRRDHNESRPHTALGWLTPNEYAASAGVNPGGCRPETRILPG